ncbi:Oidioi.mRNA.OKI2018_I69.XSR.g16682.t1.cds [Oikopleura dioica]|uniref:ribonuclease H n=1 Tax=Oikopleura dioica TaxID=34765 RepID=A0ABN7SGX4_OIKDI|nr:Oidioi.mRNA.OKI2018_I69.XSR.g16682.t1.cds [Oikopleura dioica]
MQLYQNLKHDDALNTNQYAEARAILYAARYAKRAGINRLEIRTDSKFCIESLTKFIDNWIRNADKDGIWRSQKGSPVVHQKIFREIYNISKRVNISYQYVPGHSGERGNDAADRLAEVAADRATYFYNRKKLQAKSAASSGQQKSSKLTADDLINNNNVARIGLLRFSEMQPFRSLYIRNDGYLVDDDDIVVVYTDGACRGNHRRDVRHSGSGVYWGDYRKNGRFSVYFPRHNIEENTNQFAEARAILYAARHAAKYEIDSLEIRTDSMFCIDSLTDYIYKWIDNADDDGTWYSSRGRPVVHQEIFSEIHDIANNQVDISYQYVEGHSGEEGNEEANRLAEAAADQAKQFYLNEYD